MKSPISDLIRSLKPTRRGERTPGQAMTEFALILPLLLLLIFGVMELGRLLVIYSSVHAASREAGRYAAAAGEVSAGVPYYLDATGIQNAAKRVAILVGIKSVTITYDHGPGTSTFTPAMAGDVSLRDRVNVLVTADYKPMLGLTPLKPFTISAKSSRTIIKEVPVGVASTGGNNHTPDVVIISPVEGADYAEGATITFSGTATDVEDGDLSASIVWFINDVEQHTGASFSLNNLPPGEYIIVATVSDSEFSSDTETVTITVTGDEPPEVTIILPVGGTSFPHKQPIAFQGTAFDAKDGDLSASIKWSSNLDGNLGTGASFSLSTLNMGTHVITAQVTDSKGQTGSATVTIAVIGDEPPVITITSPGDNYYLARTQTVRFLATANDKEDGDLRAKITWASSVNGSLGTGGEINVSGMGLTVGTHTITAQVMDSYGHTSSASITVWVVDGIPPTLSIAATPDRTTGLPIYTYKQGQVVVFTGTATEPTADISANIRWFLDGTEVKVGSSWNCNTTSLSLGSHTVVARILDAEILETVQSISFTVVQGNTAPTVTIIKPVSGSTFKTSLGIDFQGTATDAEQGDLSSIIQWTSSLNGTIGTGASLNKVLNIAGTHTITATVTDNGGLSASATTSIIVKAPICPQQGDYIFHRASTGSSATRRSLIWSPTVTGIVGSETFRMTALTLNLNNTSTGLNTTAQVGGQNVSLTRNGAVVTLTTTPISITLTANGTIPIAFTFTSPYVGRNDGDFPVVASFEGCPDIQILADPYAKSVYP